MSLRFSNSIRDKHIAPGVSSLTQAEIPDMSMYAKESPHWVANLFLNSAFKASFKPPMNAYAYNFLRRAQYAFSEHRLARQNTLDFLAGGGHSVTRYVDALFHWECFLSQAWHAYQLLVTAFGGKALLRNNDGSVEHRLNALYNQIKHVESRIENNGQMLPEATVPVWRDNQGLRSVDARLSYAETVEVLKDLAKYADALMNPMTASAALSELEN